ncbi:MAG: antibiotic biosynthesis monooxygenase [Pseudomonadota bacterium]
MIAVIFEVEPHPDHKDTYLARAADLRPLFEDLDGFISIERFESIVNPGKLVSLSFWRDEAAIENWRAFEAHRKAQFAGRNHWFKNYRLRVASVLRDYSKDNREEAPADMRAANG